MNYVSGKFFGCKSFSMKENIQTKCLSTSRSLPYLLNMFTTFPCIIFAGYIEPVMVVLHELELTWAGRTAWKHHTCMISALSISTTLKQHPLIWSASVSLQHPLTQSYFHDDIQLPHFFLLSASIFLLLQDGFTLMSCQS